MTQPPPPPRYGEPEEHWLLHQQRGKEFRMGMGEKGGW